VSLLSAFTVALLHVFIPTHWLCFVVVGRAQGWKLRKTLLVTAGAGLLHVASTVALGVATVVFGRQFVEDEESWEHLSGAVLTGLGLLYLLTHLFGAGHRHGQDHAVAEKVAVLALLSYPVLSPCTLAAALVVAASASPAWVALIAGVLLGTTVGGMLLLVGLTSLGIENLRFQFFDRYEKLIVGGVLCALGAVVFLLHH